MQVQIRVRYKGTWPRKRGDDEFEFPQVNDDQLDADTIRIIDNYLANPVVDSLRVTFEGVYANPQL